MDPFAAAPIHALSHEFFPRKGGIATFTESMARAATALGRSVEVWAPRADPAEDARFPFRVSRLDLKGSQDLACQLRLTRALRRRRDELSRAVVYLTDPGPILAMRFALLGNRFRPGRLAIAFHGSEILRFAANPLDRLLIGRVLLRAERLSVLSSYTRDLLENHFPQARGKTILTPGALPEAFCEAPPSAARLDGEVRFLTVGRLHPRKGQDRVLSALQALPKELRARVRWWVVGSGEKFGYAQRLRAAAAGGDVAATFFGDIDDARLAELYRDADVFALASAPFRKSVEGFGLVYLEAAAHGLPVVAHRIGGVPEAVSREENGILVDPDDASGLADAFARLIREPALRERMGAAGRIWARRNSWLRNAELVFGPRANDSLEA